MTMLEPTTLPSPTPNSTFDVGSSFDFSSLDSNLQTISAVERTWRSPALPDEVKFDLASQPGFEAGGLEGLLRGLDGDFNGDDEEFEQIESFEEPPIRFRSLDPNWGRSTFDNVRVIAADIAGEPAPTDPTPDAVELFKQRAIDLGFLERPADGVVDSTWSPELNSVRYEMMFDDYDRRLGGDRIGAVPMNRVIDVLGDWTSPGGLLAAATELDLWWDFGAIGNEFSSWGDKWRAVSESDNVLDFGKNLVDAVTGPLDDIIIPAANWALLATGVGTAVNAGRIGFMAAKAAQGGKFFNTLYRSSRVLNAASSVDDLARASMTGARLAGSTGGARSAVGGAMNAWRGYTPVVRAKQGMQIGMRYGVLSQSQDLLPGYQGGKSFADTEPGRQLNEALRATVEDPKFLPVELALAPQNIFSAGTFLRANAGRRVLGALGSAPGRAVVGGVAGAGAGTLFGDDGGDVATGALAGAVGGASLPLLGDLLGTTAGTQAARSLLGAGAGGGLVAVTDPEAGFEDIALGAALGVSVLGAKSIYNGRQARRAAAAGSDVAIKTGKRIGHVSDFLQRTSFQPLADDQRVASAFDRAVRRTLDGEDLERYRSTFDKTGSFKEAYAALLKTDVESASASVGYLMTSAAIDHTASIQAAGARAGYHGRFHLFRNKLVSQLRQIDMSDGASTLYDAAYATAMRKSPNQAAFRRAFDDALSTFKKDPDRALEFVAAHNRRSRELQRQLLSTENLPDLDPDVSNLLVRGRDAEENVGILEAYLIKDQPFMRWNEFTTQTHDIANLTEAGIFDAATFKVSTGWDTGAVRRGGDFDVPYTLRDDVDDAVLETAFRDPDVDVAKLTRSTQIAPLAFGNSGGRITVAKFDTAVKHELRNARDEVKDLIQMAEDLDVLNLRKMSLPMLEDAIGSPINTVKADQVAAALKALGGTKVSRPAARLNKFARRLGLSGEELAEFVGRRVNELADDPDRWGKMNIERFARDGDEVLTGVDALKARVRQLGEAQTYTAAEVDVDALALYWDEIDPDKAAELRGFAESLQEDGYKLVHGVEFMMPHDLLETPQFADMTRRNMHAATIGNYFRGRLPAEARAIEQRRQRLALTKQLRDRAGEPVNVEDDLVGDLLGDLHGILDSEQAKINTLTDGLRNQTRPERFTTALKSSAAPLRLEDLQQRKTLVIDSLKGMGWTEAQAEAAFVALPQFRNADFKDLGLYAIEAKLRQRNEFVQGLKFLSGTKHGESLVARTRAGRTAGAVLGGYTGMAYASAGAGDDASADESLGRKIVGGAAGAVAGAAAGTAAQGSLKNLNKLVPRAELSTYGYLGDKFARMRDTMRFTLSPYFDISRYTEGLMLAQVAAPLRRPDGSRTVMQLNMSPSGVRRSIRKSLEASGKSADEAKGLAAARFDTYREQFRAAAAGDFDPEVLDSTGKWFTQVGIMGFNPTDWMTSAFAQLRQQDFDPETSYRAVREMYTYGTRGRSAAELSTNFIFFPFSFQKKTLGHLGQFMTDDLSRSIMVHDAYKAYEILDERYDLDEFWRDHIPMLNQLERLNLFSFGISPGRFGGINAPFVESGVKAATALFQPNGVSITSAVQAAELQDVVRSLTPAINDINWMLEDVKEQGHVLTSPAHQTRRADVRSGYEEWNEYKNTVGEQLRRDGFTFSDLMNKPYLADQKLQYELKRSEIGQRYPAWFESRTKSTQNRIALEMEKNDHLVRAQTNPEQATTEDVYLFEMENLLANMKTELSYQGFEVGGTDGWINAPSEVFERIQGFGVERLKADPRFNGVWEKFYRNEFGPLEALT